MSEYRRSDSHVSRKGANQITPVINTTLDLFSEIRHKTLRVMLSNVYEFREKRRMEGHTVLSVVCEITVKRLPWNPSTIFWKLAIQTSTSTSTSTSTYNVTVRRVRAAAVAVE